MIIDRVERALDEKVGHRPIDSVIKMYSTPKWKEMLQKNNMTSEVEGLFSPKYLMAHVHNQSRWKPLTLIHEYYGHGTFFEHSNIGKKLVQVDRTGSDEEVFKSMERYLPLSEGFAIWVEDFASKILKKESLFDKELKGYPKESIDGYVKAKHMEGFGNLAFKKEYGFPKATTVNEAKELVDKLYGNHNIYFAVLYGSCKPDSDTDLFIVSNDIKGFNNEWLDVFAVTKEEYDRDSQRHLISVMDPVFTGTPLIGADNLAKERKRIYEMPISDMQINANIEAAKKEQDYIDMGFMKGRDLHTAKSYSTSFLKNAVSLSIGKKRFDKDGLLEVGPNGIPLNGGKQYA